MILAGLTLCYCTTKNTLHYNRQYKKGKVKIWVHSVQQGCIQNKLSLRPIAYAMKIQ